MSFEQKTEYPTRRRLDEERRKGNVPTSKEFTTFLMIVGYTVLLGWFLPDAIKKIFLTLKSFYNLHDQYIMHDHAGVAFTLVREIFDSLFSSIFFLIFLSIGANVIQTGFVISLKNVSPSLDKISIRKGLKRLFSTKAVVETLFATIKFLVLVIVIFIVMRGLFIFAINLHSLENSMLLKFMYDNLLNIFIIFTIFAGLVGIIDLLYKNYSYINSLRMSKQDLKDELRDTEGNPEIKSKLKSIHKSMLKSNIRKNIKEADVVITNPVHYAIALKYDEDVMPSPKVIAKGKDLVAVSIKEIALENKITVIENQALAQSLYKTVKVGDFIKEEHYAAVAEIISYIYKNRR